MTLDNYYINKNKDAAALGWKIKEQRLTKGLTQEQLSEILNIDNKKLSRIETGRSMPSIQITQELAKLLDFNFFEFMENSNTEKIDIPDSYYVQSVNILKSAKNLKEKKCYLESLKHTQKCLHLNEQQK